MSDNTTLNAGTGGDIVRTVAKTATGAKAQVNIIDVGGGTDGSAEVALSIGQKTSANSLSFVPASDLASVEPAGAAITGASLPSGGAGLTGWLSAIWKTLQSGLARSWTLSSGTDSVSATVANASLAVTGTFWPTTQPVSLASLPALAAGANVIGAVAQSGSWSMSVSGTATVAGAGTAGLPSGGVLSVQGVNGGVAQPVSLASLPSLAAGSATIGAISNASFAATQSGSWTVSASISNFPVDSNSNLAVGSAANTGGGASASFQAALSSTVTAIKASAGNLYGLSVQNTNPAPVWVQLFNLGTGSVTLGTTTPTLSFTVPAQVGVNPGVYDLVLAGEAKIGFSTAISAAATTSATGATAPTTGLVANFWYK